MKPNLRAVDNDQPHARDIARQRVNEWRSNAEREKLPVSNARDVYGAPLLQVNTIVRGSIPDHATIAKTAKSSTLLTALSQSLLRRFRWLRPILTRNKRVKDDL